MGAGGRPVLVAATALAVASIAGVAWATSPSGEGSSASGDRGVPVATKTSLRARLDVLDKTEVILRDKIDLRSAELAGRVRTLYKLSRTGWAPLWLDGERRGALVRRRGFAGRLLARDVRELGILRDELAAVERNRDRYRAAPATAVAPAPGSLVRPVPGPIVSGFGRYVGRRTGTRLMARGVELSTARGRPVVAPAAGAIEYAGPLRGLGTVVVSRHAGDVLTVVGKLSDTTVRAGDAVAAGDAIGSARGPRVYLEVRVGAGPGGLPVNPAPLLAR